MPARASWLTAAVLALAVGSAQGQTVDFASTPYGSTTGARGAVAVDLNVDGWLDLATANTGRNTVAILLNRGEGAGFAPPVEIPVGAGPFDIAAGDLNRDGIPDLVVATPDAHAIEVLLLRADGRLASRSVVASGSEARGLTLADVSRDGILDLVYTDYARSRVVLMPGTVAGGFGSPLADAAVSARPQGVVAGDFNHDGTIDLAVASTGSSMLDVLYRNALGDLTRRSIPAGRSLNVLTVADMNADGWDDIAAAATSSNVVVMFKGLASGFAVAGTRPVGAGPRGIASGDFNQDGRPDLATGNYDSGSATVLLGRRDGSVLPDAWGSLTSGNGARAIATGDFDNDGRLDLAVGAQSLSRVWVHRNDTTFVAPAFSLKRQDVGLSRDPMDVADFNENGKPDLAADRTVLLDGTTRVPLDVDPLAYVTGVDAGDYDQDGHQDALLSTVHYDAEGRVTASSLDLFFGNGKGQFAVAERLNMPLDLNGVHTGDLDRDGRLDVVALGRRALYIRRGVGSGPVAESVVTLSGSATDVELADVNRDGILDAVVSLYDPRSFAVYPGDGNGSFGAPIVAASDANSYSFKLGDLNHDGWLDIVTDGGSAVTVILANGDGGWAAPVEHPSTVPWDTAIGTILGDFNNDGHLDALGWGGAMLFGDGRGGLSAPFAFDIETPNGFAYDWNRDGLIDIVYGGQIFLNERRAVNRPPVANAGSDVSYLYHEQFYDNEWCERTSGSTDPDLHALSYEYRDETGTPFGCSFPPKAPGTYTFTLTVRDGRGGQGTDSIRVTIAPAPEIVLHSSNSYGDIRGNWRNVPDESAAAGQRFWFPNAGAPKVNAPAADPAGFVDLHFAADPTQTYKLWVRLKADNNYWGNDSVWLQFSGAVGVTGQPAYRIGTPGGLAVNLEECSDCGVSGWGWEDDGWGAVNRNGTTLRFPGGGLQTIRIQVREDGVSIDQVVLSAVAYRTTRPGGAKNDTVILPRTQ